MNGLKNNLNSYKILIVESESQVADPLKSKLENFGFTVLTILKRSEDVLEYCKLNKPELIIIDVELIGKKSGVDVAAQLRKHCDIPIIFLISSSQVGVFDTSKLLFSVDYLQKPLNDVDIQSTIKIAMYKDLMNRKLKKSETNYKDLVDQLSDALFISDENGNITDCNEKACDILGYSRDELLKLNITDYVDKESIEKTPLRFQELNEGKIVTSTRKLVKKDGTKFFAEVNAKKISNGKFQGLIRDITERLKIEEELLESNKKLNDALNIAKMGFWEWDVYTNKGYLSDEVLNIFEISRDEIDERKFLDEIFFFVNSNDKNRILDHLNSKIFSTGEIIEEFKITTPSYKIKYIYMIAYTNEFEDNIVIKGIFQDITEKKNMEEIIQTKEKQLQELTKLEIIGNIAGSIAHDYNNFFTLILGDAEIVKNHLPDDFSKIKNIDQIINIINFASSLTKQLLSFSKKNDVIIEDFSVHEQINKINDVVKMIVKNNIFKKFFNAKMDEVQGDISQFQQIIINLITNSVRALITPGLITIETENIFIESENALNLDDGNYILIRITDDGIGMDDETLEHIFEPFYTTDISGSHTGLGLSVVQSITKRFNGNIDIKSKLSKGTTVSIYLPIVNEKINRIGVKERNLDSNENKTILLVEDNYDILNMLSEILIDNGYHVLTASNGREAIEYYLSSLEEVNLVITDILIPELGGIELVKKIRNFSKDQKIILISGYVDSFMLEDLIDDKMTFLSKPFTLHSILTKIRSFIES